MRSSERGALDPGLAARVAAPKPGDGAYIGAIALCAENRRCPISNVLLASHGIALARAALGGAFFVLVDMLDRAGCSGTRALHAARART